MMAKVTALLDWLRTWLWPPRQAIPEAEWHRRVAAQLEAEGITVERIGRRHQDPGAAGPFVPKPAVRPVNPRLSRPIARARVFAAEGMTVEARWWFGSVLTRRSGTGECELVQPLGATEATYTLRRVSFAVRALRQGTVEVPAGQIADYRWRYDNSDLWGATGASRAGPCVIRQPHDVAEGIYTLRKVEAQPHRAEPPPQHEPQLRGDWG